MTNIQRYQMLLNKRQQLDAETKRLEKLVFAPTGSVSEQVIQQWHKLELKRRAISLDVARQWQTLTPQERSSENKRYQ